MRLADWFLGRPIATEEDDGERIGPFVGVGVLGLDALASASYGPEALLTVLLPLGTYGLSYLTPLVGATLVLLAFVALSYRQTIVAYPGGGGAYTVAKENLGERVSLLAAAALGLDYLLNAAVAVSAGVGALVSVLPNLLPYTLPLCLAVLAFLTLLNLRGVRATGAAFMLPTYAFVATLGAVICIGIWKAVSHGGHPAPVVPPATVPAVVTSASHWVLLRAFASGCTAMTGVEAVSNAVPIFKEPATTHARRSLSLIVGMLAFLLTGIAVLCRLYHVTATPPGVAGYQSIVSQVVAATVGRNALYYVTLGSVVSVLALSANTSFADFPRVCRMLAGDRFLPEMFVHRGRRLAFSYGIVALGFFAALLLIVFGGITEGLIPLFAVGALAAFTLSQAGMVAHWRKQSTPGARRSLVLNLIGALATGITLLVVLVSKFEQGAWITLVLVGAMLLLFRQVRRHYDFIAKATATEVPLEPTLVPALAVVPLRRWDALSVKALRFALGTGSEVVAVQVLTGDREVDDLSERWDHIVEPLERAGVTRPRLVVLRSEYRQLIQPLVSFVLNSASEQPDRQVIVVVPELIEPHWYQRLLHNQTASVLKALLLLRGRPQIVIVTIPWYLRDWLPERRMLLRVRRALGFSRQRPRHPLQAP
ncbi:MAG TPA: APC family permease [Polyangiaceae bacterium]|nr:APC family permease [Polyangiaceae bacterium]